MIGTKRGAGQNSRLLFSAAAGDLRQKRLALRGQAKFACSHLFYVINTKMTALDSIITLLDWLTSKRKISLIHFRWFRSTFADLNMASAKAQY